jgi:ferritin-like metal-binding protein YciE
MALTLETLLCALHMVEHKSLASVQEQVEISGDADTRTRLKAHLVETQWQIKLLEACLEFQGIDWRTPGREALRVVEKVDAGLLTIKRFEIALYKKIIVAARKCRAPEILQACREILEQERAMAEWLEDNHHKTALAYLPLRKEPFGLELH